ncbi:MAG: class I SAM-dependent methyltransferase [Bacteroidota bacterium]
MKKIIEWAFGVSTNKNSLGNKFRQKRILFFKEKIDLLPKPIRILDVGGHQDFWTNAGFQNNQDIQITILNLEARDMAFDNYTSVSGDATDLSEYTSNEFDIAFSNSVIEHLYTAENQKKMADEIMRVGVYHYVQTPNKYFIIEPHYLLPFFQFVPKRIRFWILTKTRLSRFKKWSEKNARLYLDEIVLLSQNDVKKLFPISKIWKERFLGFNKSFVAHNLESIPVEDSSKSDTRSQKKI